MVTFHTGDFQTAVWKLQALCKGIKLLLYTKL